ncbi:exonuclease domain-containing protein [Pseudohalocynthiibacter sp. F2068]|uniref:exonuclease domain-containing protein n=1 Tax=Pseudohalocynthiibacter sp. F2068 TaxID=2926418 RepID=UPI001FF67772|nr:exonuclease domain-containing protein [Pseudohalocynthiibacter sp. F2068]MCK0101972.1 exodeoxyribonuclease I [Pseudohalocynthiibacter sp. F2068]
MFAFYDLETTGTSPAFDQPLQFAAILTDDKFRQIERVDIRCRLAPHILPAPWAMAVTGVTPNMLEDPSLPSWYEFSFQIADLISRWAPATWTGYNTIAFDEEFLRQSFYQNLHPNLYQTQFDNNDRLDLMKVVYAAWELAPDALSWPLDDKGRQSFKLDRLAPANDFAHHDAHDALGDVEATIHLASLLRERAPDLWSQALQNRDKNEVGRNLESARPLRLIERFGAAPPRSYFGVFAGRNPTNRNSVAFLDLDLCDTARLLEADDETLAKAVSASPKLIRTIAINKVPNVFPIADPQPKHLAAADIVSARPDFQKRVGQALANRYADQEPPEHVEQKIYSGFYRAADKRILELFKGSNWEQRTHLVSQLEDERLRQLGQRLSYWNAPNFVSENFRSAAQAAVHERWVSNDPSAPWTTKAAVEKQLVEISSEGVLTAENLGYLREFYRKKLSQLV